jgi:hypothetical protein
MVISSPYLYGHIVEKIISSLQEGNNTFSPELGNKICNRINPRGFSGKAGIDSGGFS